MSERNGLTITVSQNGPYVVSGGVPLTQQIIDADEEGNSRDWREGQKYDAAPEYKLCRCGNSQNKPFCDASHLRVAFDGSESDAPRARTPSKPSSTTARSGRSRMRGSSASARGSATRTAPSGGSSRERTTNPSASSSTAWSETALPAG